MKHGWEIKKLKDVTSLITDGDWIESRHQSEDGIRLIQTGNVGNGFFKAKDDKPHFISEETFNVLGCTEIFKSDCLVSRLPDPVGRACLIPEMDCRMITAVDCSIIRFNEILVPDFFVYYSQSSKYQNEISNKTTGTTRKRISRKNLEMIPIPVPPIAEQEKIVAELDCLSGIIEKKKQQLKELDNLAQSIFYEMFGDPVENDKGWDVSPLKDVCLKITDGTHNSPKSYSAGAYMYITAKNIKKDGFDMSNITYVPEDIHRSIYSRCNPVFGDILYIKDGATTGIAMLNSMTEEFSLLSSVALLKCDKKQVSNVFIRDVLNFPSMCKAIRESMGGAAITRLTLKKIEIIKTLMPPIALQQEYASKIESIEKQKELIAKSIKESETLFNSRMDYYFN